ncbi:TRAP transporter small permease subunit [Devosia sp. YIM 151766]|uniref:TRAP transporter small permease n=1 Tax=Devosia sp. YIM 151766 TaxID=3017325 RepID=UPI00255CBC98|nr:TRAP transporter small permease subunit [Devosia sp. YIM 151766]WIY52390.1 TRAP transporter small permease subunit [Devosia sp. YIM 151766]
MARLGGFLLLGAAILVTVEVIGRSSHLFVISLGTELATYALAVAATWSLAYVVFERAHVRVDVLAQRLPPLPKALLDLLALASLAAVGAVLASGGIEMFTTSLRLASKSNTTLGMPLVIPHGAWTFGLIWFTAVSLFRLVQGAMAIARHDYAEAARISAAPSADDEVEDAIADTEQRLSRDDAA